MFKSVTTILRGVTVEPVMLLYYTSLAITELSGQNLILQKACHPGGDVAPLPTAVCAKEQDAQKLANDVGTWKYIVLFSVPVVFNLFAGPWSDKHARRKPLMYLPLFGQILSDLLNLLNVVFWSWSPVVAALSQSIPTVVTGWRPCFIIGVTSYLADITSEQSRTFRLGIKTAIYFLGSPIGSFIFGLVFRKIYFYGVFILCVVFNTIALVYLYFFVPEVKNKEEEPKLNVCDGLVDVKQVLESVKTVLKERNGYGRAILFLLFLAGPLSYATMEGW